MTCWILGYFLVGFVISWSAAMAGLTSTVGWRWELVFVICWPIGVVVGIVSAEVERRRAEEKAK